MIKIEILPNAFLNEDLTFNKEKALLLSGQIAGVCYSEEGFNSLKNEPLEKTKKRIKSTLVGGHHSVYDHIMISLNIQNIPKILAMYLNNENQYTTSEKSARYTEVNELSGVSKEEEFLYNKWVSIFTEIISDEYGSAFKANKIKKIAMENARYLVSIFMETQMIYTTSLRQINYLASFMNKIIEKEDKNDFEIKLAKAMEEFISELERLNILEDGLMKNEKNRHFSLVDLNLTSKDYFDDVYQTTYKGSFAQLAQAQRHRTIDYKINFLNEKEFFVPPIIDDNEILRSEWLKDIESLSENIPQGRLILIKEMGKYEDFILKCKERLCSSAQLEIAQQTEETLMKYYLTSNSFIAQDIEKYLKGARCTFPDFKCFMDCHFKEGKTLTRKI